MHIIIGFVGILVVSYCLWIVARILFAIFRAIAWVRGLIRGVYRRFEREFNEVVSWCMIVGLMATLVDLVIKRDWPAVMAWFGAAPMLLLLVVLANNPLYRLFFSDAPEINDDSAKPLGRYTRASRLAPPMATKPPVARGD